jgi:1-acyl-sn-glycerol-3-phosphate acyltransferase
MAVHSDLATPAGLSRQDAYYWRLVMTAVGFAFFGVSALLVGAVLLPLVRLFPASLARKGLRARAVIGGAMRLYIGVMRALGTVEYEFHGAQRLGRPGQLIVANHPTLIDVIFVFGFARGANCVVKQQLWRNPLTRNAVTLAGYLTNDPTAAMIESATQALRSGQTLVMFPEGTRTRPHEPLVFHRGAANVALRAASVVTPVYIRCEPMTLTKGEPWYRIPPRRPRFTLVVGEDLDPAPYRSTPLPIASRAFNEQLHARFQSELARMADPVPGRGFGVLAD